MDYNKQAIDFLTATKTTLLVRWLNYDKYFTGDDKKRDIYEVELKKGDRKFIFTFGNSIADREELIKHCFNVSGKLFNYHYSERCLMESPASLNNDVNYNGIKKYNALIASLKEWHEPSKDFEPSAYSILAGLTKYEPEDNIDDFATEFGYTKLSEAIKAYEAVKNEWQNIKMLFSDDEIEALGEIS